jgi:hypothetical protein
MKPTKIRQHGWHSVNKKQFLQSWQLRKPSYLLKYATETTTSSIPEGLNPIGVIYPNKQRD